MGEETEAKRSLLHILMIYCTHYNKTVGYCQGMTLDCAILTDDPVPTCVCSAADHYQILFAMLGMAYVAALLLMSNMLEEVWAFKTTLLQLITLSSEYMYIYVRTLYNGPLKLIIEILLGNGQGNIKYCTCFSTGCILGSCLSL